MDQFSHDLTLALEETKSSENRWGQRRRTRSTGNLPCAPQPTEDSSSSPNGIKNISGNYNIPDQDCFEELNTDSDDQVDLRLSFKNTRCIGNFESDSLNENFSPARFFRPNIRRKRKLKRMTIEYETATSTPGITAESTINVNFPITGIVKKRVIKADSYRTNIFFCGKRKRSHRDRYYDHDHVKQHSSSAPRQNHIFTMKSIFTDSKMRTKSFSSSTKPSCERILPLNKGLISKIEKISQKQKLAEAITSTHFSFGTINLGTQDSFESFASCHEHLKPEETTSVCENNYVKISSFTKLNEITAMLPGNDIQSNDQNLTKSLSINKLNLFNNKNEKHKHNKLRAQLQFDDPNSMECGDLNEFLSSSSLSSSDSEDEETNDSDHEGDDELTDWPGNEVMINFASKNDFKRKSTKKTNLPLKKSEDFAVVGEDDTLMSGDEMVPSLQSNNANVASLFQPNKLIQSAPITIYNSIDSEKTTCSKTMHQFRFPIKQIESEMSGETSNTFLASPPNQSENIREIRAGCRRIKEERPGFTIKTSVNERLAKFLQDGRQTEIRLPDLEILERESLASLAKLYSLQISDEHGCAALKKTSNTTQSVKVDQQNLQKCFSLSDYKRRCYDGRIGKNSNIEGNTGISNKNESLLSKSSNNALSNDSNR